MTKLEFLLGKIEILDDIMDELDEEELRRAIHELQAITHGIVRMPPGRVEKYQAAIDRTEAEHEYLMSL